MIQNWIEYEGRMAGAWRLDSFLGTHDGIAAYAASSGNKRSTVKIVTLEEERPAAVRSSWELAKHFSSDHLLKI